MTPFKSSIRAPTADASPDDIEAIFYDCMREGDLNRLMSCWAEDHDEIACIQPTGMRTRGAAGIRAVFESMFATAGPLNVRIVEVHKFETLRSSVHHVLERVELDPQQGEASFHVLTSNVYYKSSEGWRLVLHHASTSTLERILELQEMVNPSAVFH
jgi:ketosteroid isomerase-like protein